MKRGLHDSLEKSAVIFQRSYYFSSAEGFFLSCFVVERRSDCAHASWCRIKQRQNIYLLCSAWQECGYRNSHQILCFGSGRKQGTSEEESFGSCGFSHGRLMHIRFSPSLSRPSPLLSFVQCFSKLGPSRGGEIFPRHLKGGRAEVLFPEAQCVEIFHFLATPLLLR